MRDDNMVWLILAGVLLGSTGCTSKPAAVPSAPAAAPSDDLPQAADAANVPWAKPVAKVVPGQDGWAADGLRAEDIPLEERLAAGRGDAAQAPAELVAVFGNSRLKHWNTVMGVAYSSDGKSLFSASYDGEIIQWNAETGEAVRRLAADRPSDEHTALCQLPDGKQLVSASCDWERRISWWDLTTGKELRAVSCPGEWTSGWGTTWLAFSRDGKTLAVVDKAHAVHLIDTQTGKDRQVLRGHAEQVRCLALTADGSRVASADKGGKAFVWEATSGKQLAKIEREDGPIRAIAFSPDGNTVATGHGDHTVRLWDGQTASPVSAMKVANPPISLAFSPDGQSLAAGCDHGSTICLCEVKTGRVRHTLVYHAEDRPLFMAFSPDSKSLACGYGLAGIGVWDVATAKPRYPRSGHSTVIKSVAAESQGMWLASGATDGRVFVWDIATSRPVCTVEAGWRVNSVEFLPDGQRVLAAACAGHVKLLDRATGRVLRALDVPGTHWTLPGAALGCDGTLVATAEDSHAIRLSDLSRRRPPTMLSGHSGHITAMAFSPVGQLFASADEQGGVTVWDSRSGKQERAIRSEPPRASSLGFSPDGKLLACGLDDGTIGVWDTATWELLRTLPGRPHRNASISGLNFSADSRVLAMAGPDNAIRLWSANNGGLLKAIHLGPPGSRISSLVFLPDGRHLATANRNGTLYLLRLGARPGPLRHVAQWALEQGGKVLLGGCPAPGVELARAEDLPSWEPTVQGIDLSGVKALGDEDLVRLIPVTGLEELNLQGCEQITDGAVPHLARLGNLNQLQLQGTKVTTDALVKLRQTLPKCTIEP